MIFDKDLLFSDEQAITASAASTNYVDVGYDGDIGKGEPVRLDVRAVENFNLLTSLTIALQTCDEPTFTVPRTMQSHVMPLADLNDGTPIFRRILREDYQQYIRLYYTVTGTNPTAGKISAGIVFDYQDQVPSA